MKLGLPRPKNLLHDLVSLRVRALNGEPLRGEELHAALAHLFKRRGYSAVPWANREAGGNKKDGDKEEGIIKERVKDLRNELNGLLPCQYLAKRRTEVGASPKESWGRKIYWPREFLEQEFRAILKAQENHFPKLASHVDWLLYGEARPKRKDRETFRVFFNANDSRNPGVLGLRWNRGPALDSFQPINSQGRPLHVVRKNKQAFTKAQWELALMNFCVLDANTRQKLDPRIHFPIFIDDLRNELGHLFEFKMPSFKFRG